ncbi:AIPR family protein, partial [Erysipelothrix rhusiopathiae]|nr:AIPR family protein [Erysipelothrix rhusiopathiae]
ETDQNRLGFYLFILESITGNKDIDEILDLIIDTEFCKIVFNEVNNDYGVDAVHINDETKEISLFNFKFRTKFSKQKGQSTNDVADSMKFFSFLEYDIDSNDIEPGRTQNKIKEILERLNSPNIWTITLYMVSNEIKSLPSNDKYLDNIKEVQDIEIVSIGLDAIIEFLNMEPENLKAELLFDSSSVMKYQESELSSSISYLATVNVLEMVRITSKNEDLRLNYQLKESNDLKSAKLEQSVLFDNVRGFLGNTKYNKNISKTLNDNPEKFFMYNNGITITVNNVIAEERKRQGQVWMSLDGFQIVNGGQTLRSIYEEKDRLSDLNLLNSANVLVRIFQTNKDAELTNNIAEYTNSQNTISSSDLKSVSNLQIRIEKFLETHNILYVRKVGDTGSNETDYSIRISMERVGQILYSKMGFPDRATNQKKRIFEVYYNDIFNDDLNFQDIVDYINEYEEIKNTYNRMGVDSYEQKYFYILYLNNFDYDIPKNINLVEKALDEFKKDEEISVARKLIQKGFKEVLDRLAR